MIALTCLAVGFYNVLARYQTGLSKILGQTGGRGGYPPLSEAASPLVCPNFLKFWTHPYQTEFGNENSRVDVGR